MPGAELLGPAPLLRLRTRHRAQLVAKTDRPRALADAGGGTARRAAAPPPCVAPASTVVVDVDPQDVFMTIADGNLDRTHAER